MPDNKPLLAAARGRADEFYTRYEDAERGLTPFRDAFRGADVLLDTNDGDWSAFWHFLSDRFDDWGLSRLRSLSFDPTADTLFAPTTRAAACTRGPPPASRSAASRAPDRSTPPRPAPWRGRPT